MYTFDPSWNPMALSLEEDQRRLQKMIDAVEGTDFEVASLQAGAFHQVRITAVVDSIDKVGELIPQAELVRQRLVKTFGPAYAVVAEITVERAPATDRRGSAVCCCQVTFSIPDCTKRPSAVSGSVFDQEAPQAGGDEG